jgi:hypothetical protein
MSLQTTNLLELLNRLEERGVMYIQPFTYETTVAFLSGYNHAMVSLGESNLLDSFREWLHERVGHHCSLSWPTVVRDIFAKGDSSLAIQELFGLLRAFLNQLSGAPGEERGGKGT